MAETDSTQTAKRRMLFRCRKTRATDTHTQTHSEYAIVNALPGQQRSRECGDSMLRYTYTASLVNLLYPLRTR